jgi:hypothetical protein
LEDSAGRKQRFSTRMWRLFTKAEGSTEGLIKAAVYNKKSKQNPSLEIKN